MTTANNPENQNSKAAQGSGQISTRQIDMQKVNEVTEILKQMDPETLAKLMDGVMKKAIRTLKKGLKK